MALWCSGFTTVQFHLTKLELKFCTGLNPACGVSEIQDGEYLGNDPS